ncbi:MAG: amino acid ABC transporter ATP-binding protein [Desulfuromonadaceae bacterium]|nr:amino acid ABC transporter ATP-binding protein [Desulfuromonadaceae bacterium]
MMEVLRAEGIFKSRTDSRKGLTKEILKGIDLSLGKGELWALIGPSGGGKTTLIRLFNRLEEPSAGRILFHGQDIRDGNPLELRRRVMLIQQKAFMFSGTVLDNLQRSFVLGGEAPPPADDRRIRRAVDLCCLPANLIGEEARALSAGQQQRVHLARGLLCRPEILILDEGTSALDRPTAEELISNFRNLCREEGLTILMVSHDLPLMERAADKGLYLEGGKILEQGAAPDFFRKPESPQMIRFMAEMPARGE